MGHFRRINLIYNTILNASTTLGHFIVILGATFYAFVWFAYTLLSKKMLEFSQFMNAFIECMAMVFGDMNLFHSNEMSRARLTLVLLPLTAWFLFFMFGMLVSILVNSYEEQSAELEAWYR